MRGKEPDICLGFFDTCYDAGLIPIPPQAHILEVGCAEADWSSAMKARRVDVTITGIDPRFCERPNADRTLQASVLDPDLFPPASFDVVVAVSTLEHVGLGFYGDPVQPDGDVRAMQNIRRWLKPSGCLYFDVPTRDQHQECAQFRAYDPQTLRSRLLDGWTIVAERRFEPNHPDGPYVAVTAVPA